ncbi:MAG: 16S rRNA (guanine(527)-N(7))-methyltransferase RsmG [Bacilli bacterium]|nr:16S rRNA (guanine(527)-N(7))-methyltransferase RsmG [Bacilli bacterium]
MVKMNKELFLSHLNELNIEVTEEKLNKLEKFYELLIDWNNKINLTRIVEKEEVYLKHFYDSLTIVKEVDLNKVETLCDVGTGAGFPGIVLKIFYPHLKITLVDSLLKRVNYLNTIIKDLELNNIVAIHARGEDVKEKFDIVTSRAVANIEKLVVYTMHLVNKTGRLVALKGDIDKELNDDVKRKLERKYIIEKINKFELPIENSKRSLVILKNK